VTAEFRSVVVAHERPIDRGDGSGQGVRYTGIEALRTRKLPRLERRTDLARSQAQAGVKGGRAVNVSEVQIGVAHNDLQRELGSRIGMGELRANALSG
jgi:hypothetical protein